MVLHIIYLLSLLFAVIAGFTWRRQLKGKLIFPFFPLACYLLLQETILFFIVQRWPDTSTGIFYNLYVIAITIFMAVIYYRVPFNKPYRKLITGFIITYLVAAAVSYLFLQSILTYSNYLQISGGFIIDFLGIVFLFNYFQLDDSAEEENWRPLLWITIGAVIYYPVVNICFAPYNLLKEYNATFFGAKLYRVIPQAMSIFMYSCFIYAFYLCKKKN